MGVTIVAAGRRDAVEIPTLPTTLAAIIEATARPDVTLSEIGRLVAADPGFAVRVLRLVNSSFHTRGNQIASVHKAVSHLGLQSLRNLALTTAATGGADARALYPFDLPRFWEESLRRAAASEVLAETGIFGPIEAASAFTAGLLQDLPVLALIRALPGKGEAWMNWIGEEPERRRREERKLFGRTHDELAAELCSSWGLPVTLAMPMQHHHRHEEAPEAHRTQCHLHEVAETLAAVYGSDDTATAWRSARTLLAPLMPRGGEPAVDRLIEQVGSRVTSAARSLGMLVSEQPDLERLRRQAKRSAEMSDLNRTQLVSRVQRLVARNDALQRELAQMRHLIDTLTATDAVTGLPNERALEVRLGQEVRRAARSGKGVALLALRLTLHDGADPVEVQQSVGVALGATMRNTDVVARVAELTFEVLLTDTTVAGAFVAARRALSAMRGDLRDPPWTPWFGVACLEGTPTFRPATEPLVRRLRTRAHENLGVAMLSERPLVRTELELEPWSPNGDAPSDDDPSPGEPATSDDPPTQPPTQRESDKRGVAA